MTLYFIVLICSIAMNPRVLERHIGHRVAAKKNVSFVVIRFWLTLSFIYMHDYFKLFS